MLYTFAWAYDAREESEGATLALATLVRHHPDDPLAREARERLGKDGGPALDGQDPLPLLVSRIDRMHDEGGRQKLRRTCRRILRSGLNAGY